MTTSTILLVLLVLACPLMMMWMMRGGHGHGAAQGHAGGRHGGETDSTESRSTAELRRQRDELERQIAEREQAAERELELTPTAGKR